MQRRIAVLVSDGFTDSGLSVALDVFRAANALAVQAAKTPPFVVDVVSAAGGRVRAASGMVLESTFAVARASRADVVLVPGWWIVEATEMDAVLARADVRRLVRALAKAHARGAIVGASCGGAFALAEAGVLDGKEATTAWWLGPHLQRRHPRVRVKADRALIVGDRVLCAGAVFAQADLALHVVAHFAGPSIARGCARVLLLDTHASQTPYMALQHLCANDRTVRAAEVWVREHLAEDFDMNTLARHVGASPRTLARRLTAAVGLSPIGFVRRLRAETAVHLLATTRLSLQEVSTRVGYADAGTLRRLVRAEGHALPRDLRARVDRDARVGTVTVRASRTG